jgi:hemerythrin
LIAIKNRLCTQPQNAPMSLHAHERQPMQQTLEWNEAFSVSHPALDFEHREIMQAIRAIAEALDSDCDAARLRPLLCALKEKAAAHFSHEDAILREIVAYTSTARSSQKFLATMSQALVEEHCSEHARAANVLDAMIRDTLRDVHPAPASLGGMLTHWFVNHAVKHDAHLKMLFQTMANDSPELLSRLV